MIFAFMVPITLVAFLLGAVTTEIIREQGIAMNLWDIVGLLLSTVGVFMFNIYEEKPQKASIEQF